MRIREDKMVALKITKGKNPHEIIEIYLNNALENDNKIWYSTNIKMAVPKRIEKVLFFSNRENNEFYYIADVLDGIKGNDEKRIEEIKILEKSVPEEYKDEPRNSWLLIKNIEKIDKSDLKQYYAEKDDESLFSKINKKRINRVYFY